MPKIFKKTIINDSEMYDDFYEQRGVKSIKHNLLKNLNLSFNQEDYSYTLHVWRKGDTMIRLANKYYNNFSFWYIIGYFNKKPVDSMYETGETIKIPSNIRDINFLISQG